MVTAMSVSATSNGPVDTFDAVLRKAGAVFAPHHGRSAAANYGSAARESWPCVSARLAYSTAPS